MRMIDLSAPIRDDSERTAEWQRTEIEFIDHEAGARAIQQMLGVPATLLRNSEGWAVETFRRLGTHNSTHVDAPWHYNSEIGGKRAQTIDELPLEWFFAPGIVIEATDRADGDALTRDDIQMRLPRELKERDIVLVHTGQDANYGAADYSMHGPGVTAEATRWMFEQGVRVMGTDSWGWDAPLHLQAKAALERNQPGIFWAAHQVGLPYSQIERLCNLASLPPFGFHVACFPLRVMGGSAAPARVVALIPEESEALGFEGLG
jgi:kynurenine formamidase